MKKSMVLLLVLVIFGIIIGNNNSSGVESLKMGRTIQIHQIKLSLIEKSNGQLELDVTGKGQLKSIYFCQVFKGKSCFIDAEGGKKYPLSFTRSKFFPVAMDVSVYNGKLYNWW